MDPFCDGIVLPRLIRQLKSILDQYPDDGQILKEMIQNADDAGASKIIFLIDDTQYGTESLYNEKLAQFQGPALYVYNNAVFKDDDWIGIRTVLESCKENDPLKIGRFGLGFKSVFHMTDLPSMFSGERIGFLDPHEQYFTNSMGSKTSSYGFHLKNDKEKIKQYKDQFKPFIKELFRVSQQTFDDMHFDGTIFRFPFRCANAKSELSQTVYTASLARTLVESLVQQAELNLVFLRNLESMEVYEFRNDLKNGKQYKICISPSCLTAVRQKRNEFTAKIMKQCNWLMFTGCSVSYPISFDVTETNVARASKCVTLHHWLVAQYYAGKNEASSSQVTFEPKYVPLVGIARWVQKSNQEDSKQQRKYEEKPWNRVPDGQMFCFLPLPLQLKSPTGLRIHVNGAFAVEQNRRHIKWPSSDQNKASLTDKDLLWNMFLVKNVLPKAIITLIDDLRPNRLCGLMSVEFPKLSNDDCANLIYAIIPEKKHIPIEYDGLVENVSQELAKMCVFYVPGATTPQKYKDVIFDMAENQSSIVQLMRKIMYANNENLVSVPSYVFKLLPHDKKEIKTMMVMNAMKKVQSRCDLVLTNADRKTILEYFLNSIVCEKSLAANLVGLELLPVNGRWIQYKLFNRSLSVQDTVYVEPSRRHPVLVPGLESQFLDINLMPVNWNILLSANTQVKTLDSEAVAQLLPMVFRDWTGEEFTLNNCHWFTKDWLNTIWRYLRDQFPSDLSRFHNLPLLPIGENKVICLSKVAPIVGHSNEPSSNLDNNLIHLCKSLEIKIVLQQPEMEAFNHKCVGEQYILSPKTGGLFEALVRLSDIGGKQHIIEKFSAIDEETTTSFVKHTIQSAYYIKDESKKLLRLLPIFRTVAGSGNKPTHFVSLQSIKYSTYESAKIPLPCPKVLVDLSVMELCNLAKKLGTEPDSIANLLLDIYFPEVNKSFSENEIYLLMDFVRTYLEPYHSGTYISPEIGKLKCSLLNLPFITCSDGSGLHPAKHFFDPTVEIFVVMEDANQFPPKEYNSAKWIEFLREFGLVYEITKENFIRYARCVEKEAKMCEKISAELLKKSRLLLQNISYVEDRDDRFFSNIKEIRFISPQKIEDDLDALCPQFGSRNRSGDLEFVCCKNSYLSKDRQLIWTIGNILPSLDIHCTGSPSYQIGRKLETERLLEIKELTLETVVAHTRRLCQHIVQQGKDASKTTKQGKTLTTALEEIYKFLIVDLDKLDSNLCSELKVIPCIAIEESGFFHLVLPSQTAWDIAEIKPHLFRTPIQLYQFSSLLERIGSTKHVTYDQYGNILKTIYESCEPYSDLTCSEKDIVCRTIGELFNKLAEEIAGINKPKYIPELYLPCSHRQNNILIKSNNTIYIDNPQLLTRSREWAYNHPILINFTECNTTDVKAELIFQHLPTNQKPEYISSILKEVAVLSPEIDCSLTKTLSVKLSSDKIQFALERLVMHSIRNQIRRGTFMSSDFQTQVKEILTYSKTIRFVGHQSIATELYYKDRKCENSSCDRDCYCEMDSGKNVQIIHITTRLSNRPSSIIYRTVASCIARSSLNLLDIEGMLTEVLSSPANDDINSILDKEDILTLETSRKETKTFRIQLGSEVPLDDHILLDQDVMKLLWPGQIVALEKDDPALRGQSGDPIYILVQVIQKLSTDDDIDSCILNLTAKYRVKICERGNEEVIKASGLYAFVRNKTYKSNLPLVSVDAGKIPKSTMDSGNGAQTDQNEPKVDFAMAVEKIKKCLKKAWKMSEDDKRKIVKRLYLQYHPDKNDDKALYTKIFQKLKHLVSMMEEGKSLDDDVSESESCTTDPKRNEAEGQGEYFGKKSWFNDIFSHMHERAGRHRFFKEERSTRKKHSRKRGSAFWQNYEEQPSSKYRKPSEEFFAQSSSNPNLELNEARQWLKQANYDIKAATGDSALNGDWCLFKHCKGVELALHAVHLTRNCSAPFTSHSALTSHCEGLQFSRLNDGVRQLQDIVPSVDHLLYPHDNSIPHDVFSREQAESVLVISTEIVKQSSSYVYRHILYNRAVAFHQSDNVYRVFYRNMPSEVYEDIISIRGGNMTTRLKDRNGDPMSPINGKLKGLFFSANVDSQGDPIPTSPFGDTRIIIPAKVLLERCPNLYFTDFYCLASDDSRPHYVTLVMTKDGSKADQFCIDEGLIKLNPDDKSSNPFLWSDDSDHHVHGELFIEIFYTEDIDIVGMCTAYGAEVKHDIKTIGAGVALGDVPKNARCRTCNTDMM